MIEVTYYRNSKSERLMVSKSNSYTHLFAIHLQNGYICKKQKMIRKLKYAIIADIATFDLTYFDDQEESESIDICKINGYTYLPSRCEKFVYKLENDQFKKVAIEMIDDNLKVNPSDLILIQK